jgi:hypothetical protein
VDLVGSGAAPHADCWMALHIFSTRQRRGAFDFLGKVNSLSYNIGYSDVGGYVRCAKMNDPTLRMRLLNETDARRMGTGPMLKSRL